MIGVDPSQRLLEVAAADAEERDLDAEFVLGEGASMPISQAEADVVVSVFGAIFAEDPAAAAAEIARVTKPSGRVVLSAWIPGGPVSDAIRLARNTVTEVLDEPPAPPPFAWHEPGPLTELFEPHGFSLSLTEHPISFSAPSIDEFMRIEGETTRSRSQPAVLEQAGRAEEVRAGMRRIYEEANEDPEGLRITSRYAIAELTRYSEESPYRGDDAIVVEAHQLDHVADVLVRVDPASRHRVLAGENRMVDNPALLPKRAPTSLPKLKCAA